MSDAARRDKTLRGVAAERDLLLKALQRIAFDHRLQVTIPAAQFEDVAWFVASVIQQCLDPKLGRRFPEVHEVTVTT